MENYSDLIVYGTKLSEGEPTIQKTNGDPIVSYVYSDFKVQEVVKNSADATVQADDIIQIMEHEVYDKEENKIYRINDYTNMLENNEYILFLKKSPEDEYYYPCGVNFGKVPLLQSDIARNDKTDLSESVQEIRSAAVLKYQYLHQ